MPYTQQALNESRRFGVRPVPTLRPLAWLGRGWQDLRRCALLSLLQGLLLLGGGVIIYRVWGDHFGLLAGAFSGLLLVAPVLATGFYASSRALERGQKPGLHTLVQAFWPGHVQLIKFGLLLGLAGAGWMLCSAALITLMAPGAVHTPTEFLYRVVLAEDSLLFPLWLALGALLAAPVFASSVVAVPLLMDQRLRVLAAVFASWRVVMEHPAPCALWAFLIMALVGLGMATAMLGLVVILPWLGHASWHAYRDLVRQPVEH
ncbi:DUF2189 domain-containing protein [Roseateles sp. BYS180W]|uniref:DUF2189 domain-containing protein n=1 Tax=Roseateles rivi TaxID=3299028 RepID=A0ABW7FSM8_9BURK